MILQALTVYLLAVNLVLFALMGIDKRKAIQGKWRIPEKTLFGLALAGGSIGGIAGMQLFRHKTKHASFKLGFPAILAAQLVLAGWMVYLFWNI